MAYVILMYRRKMGVSYQEVRDMPINQLYADLEMLSLEAEYGPQNAKPTTPDQPKMS